jgi:hypothetical protein
VHAQVSVRFSNVYYQTSDLNNNRGDASVALVRSLSATSNVSLNVAAERVLYQDERRQSRLHDAGGLPAL